MIKIGITGQDGFIGYHLFQHIKYDTQFQIIDFDKSYFNNPSLLEQFVASCDIIIHLAAINRTSNQTELYHTNIELVEKLIHALENTRTTPQVIMASSSQEENGNVYGNSKKAGRLLFEKWALKNNAIFNGLLIPNVFGPFGKPNYNSVVATFCWQIINDIPPNIQNDNNIKLIYIGKLVHEILELVIKKITNLKITISESNNITVTELLKKLLYFKEMYLKNGIIPVLESKFDLNLFNTFRSFIKYESHFPQKYLKNIDERGAFVELGRMGIGGQISFSTTNPLITRGNHFHTRKIERFSVIKGKAIIKLRKIGTNIIHEFELDGKNPSYVDMPIWYTHNIKNVGDEELFTVFWINEPYNSDDPDTYFEIV